MGRWELGAPGRPCRPGAVLPSAARPAARPQQEPMSTGHAATWAQRVPPTPTAARDTWTWAIARPAELTAARTDLRRSLPAGASPDDVDRLLLASRSSPRTVCGTAAPRSGSRCTGARTGG
ncbi:protein of unknown function [Modestobacter italicus]|uniref:Uncharacterized protein n=1 Tax=Modestobacter italicus (strain DSM 44449 / CECT 9708 / BC 501) TaxID=2732864 RepID=I4EXN5_MODI5|nr:protein of unknown function [Modestobacter marinus]